jgi:hypothetical protein
MAVFGNDYAILYPVTEVVRSRLCHPPGGFACSHKQHPTGELPPVQGPLHCRVWLNGRDGFPDDLIRMISQ